MILNTRYNSILFMASGGGEKMLYIMYFNLKDDVSEEEFVKKSKEFGGYIQGKVEGFGSGKLYRHHIIGTNQARTYQMHIEFKDFGTWDRFLAFHEKDAELARLLQEWQNLIDMNTHYDEHVREIPL
jgi:hypothetical protein